MYSTNSFNPGDSGQHYDDGTKTPGIAYFSPWDIWFNRGADFVNKQPAYLFWNGNVDGGGEPDAAYSPYTLEVTAYVGLAYYDGDNDGFFNDPSPGGSAIYNLANGNYLTLYDNNTPNGFPQEIGALVPMQPFTINPMEGFRMEDKEDHLPLGNAVKYTQYQKWFIFQGGLSQDEMDLLRDYGKVFFYEVRVFENGALIDHVTLHPNIETLHSGHPDWKPAETTPACGLQMQGFVPSLGTQFNLHYYRTNLPNGTDWAADRDKDANKCDSREVVFFVPPSLSSHNITGGSVPKILYLSFSQNPFTFWQNSSLNLNTY